jgi:4-amino-4-deoxy-L-arabinose transferase-like glycosyltransferase
VILKRPRTSALLSGVLLFYFALAVWYSVTIPLGEAPDEVPHFTYVRYLARYGRLPTTEEEHEAFQPPLYYALGAALTFWIEDEPDAAFAVRANAYYDVADPSAPKNLLLHSADEAWPYRGWVKAWHLVRLISIILGGITVWAVYRLGLVLFPSQSVVPLTMAALTAFTPQFIFLSAVANNDNAALTFSALILWQVTALLHEGRGRRIWQRCALLGLLLGLGLLSKANLIGLLPVVGLAILVAIYRTGLAGQSVQDTRRWERLPAAAGRLLLTFGLAALLSGWYFVRNWMLHGDPMGWSFLLAINARREGPLNVDVLAWLLKGVFRSFWLGWIGIAFDEAIYWMLGVVCLVGMAGFAVWLLRSWRALDGGTKWSFVLLGLHAAITLGSLLQWTATVLGTDQGRLIYPILPTVMLILVTGWAWWARPGARGWVLGGLAAVMLVLAVLTPIRYIMPVHASAPEATAAELAAAHRINVGWGNVRLLGYRLENNEVQPGSQLVLHLYWQGLQPIEQDLMALVQLVDEEGTFLMYADGTPTAGRDTTDRWQPGVPLASRHILSVPDYGQPGNYRLTISLYPFGQSTWLPAMGPDGSLLGDQFVLPETVHLVSP